jgi:dinuclear metal center YbgI/SA1388 family protein
MSLDVYSISHYLSQLLDAPSFDDLISNGIQVEGSRSVQAIATAVSANRYTIEEAIRQEADLLITHHGLFTKPGVLEIQGQMRYRLEKLLHSGIHLLSYHLPLDAHPTFGNAWPVAHELGWQEILPFGLYGRKYLGVKGKVAPIRGEDLFSVLQKYWGVKGSYFGADEKSIISSCAFLSGSGLRFLDEAIKSGIDCFITGTTDDRVWDMAREAKIHYMAFGHVATEKTGVQLLGRHLAQHFGLKHTFINEDNPF